MIIDPTRRPEPSEEEKTAQLLHALEYGGYDACDFGTRDERAERIARSRRQGFSYDEIADMTDWSQETVRKALRTLDVHRFNSSVSQAWADLGTAGVIVYHTR